MIGPELQNCLTAEYYNFQYSVWWQVVKKCQNLTFKVNILCQISTEFF